MCYITQYIVFILALQAAFPPSSTNCSAVLLNQPSRLMITFLDSSDNDTMDVDLNGTVIVKQYGRRLLLDLNEPFDLDAQRDLWMTRLKNVEMVEVDGIASVALGIYDPPWYFRDWEEFSVKVDEVLNNPIDNSDIVVAVLDTGIAEIAKVKFWGLRNGYDFVSSIYTSKDGDGRDADATDPGDGGASCVSTWHGTSVSSIIGASHTGAVVRGIAPYCTLLSIRIGGDCGRASFSDMADAIVWAAGGRIDGVPDNPARAHIISLSYVGESACSSYLQSAINQAVDLGSLVIVAAGNDEMHVSHFAPANCANVVSVAANGKDGLLAPYSNWGATVTAPGGSSRRGDLGLEVWSVDQANNKVVNVITIGTSFAAPHVAALASLIKHDPVNTIQKQFNRYILEKSNSNPPQVLMCRNSNCAGELITWPKLKSITACESCPEGQYRVECNSTSPGRCANCEACPSGKYRIGCRWMSPGVCTDCALQCESNQYVSMECGGTSPGVCSFCESCPEGQYRIECGNSSAGRCVTCQVCPSGKYMKDCRLVSPGVCTDCALQCQSSQYVSTECGGTSPGVCSFCYVASYCGSFDMTNECITPWNACFECHTCPAGKYRKGVCFDRYEACTLCPSCPIGQYRNGCGSLHVGSCVPCPSCPIGQYRNGCGSLHVGSCVPCPLCQSGQYRVGCAYLSPGVCTSCTGIEITLGSIESRFY